MACKSRSSQPLGRSGQTYSDSMLLSHCSRKLRRSRRRRCYYTGFCRQHPAYIGLQVKLFLSQGCSLQELDRRRFLLRYVQAIQPEVMEDFVQHAPAHVRLQYTSFGISSLQCPFPCRMVSVVSCSCSGRRRHEPNNQKLPWYSFAAILPNQHFSQGRRPCTAYVHYDDVGLHVQKCTLPTGAARQYVALRCRTPLHPLCISVDCAFDLDECTGIAEAFSCACSGYQSFDEYDLPPALPIMGMLDHRQDGKYAPGSQKTRVSGEVLRWHHENGTESVPASEYIEKLESENRILKQQV